jgi:hypothetical protein
VYQSEDLGSVHVYADESCISARGFARGRQIYVLCEPGSTSPGSIRSIVARVLMPQVRREAAEIAKMNAAGGAK